MKKSHIGIKIIVCILVIAFAGISLHQASYDGYELKVLNAQGLAGISAGIADASDEPGQLVQFNYKSAMLGTEKKLTRHAMVYLPYGYDPEEEYDIMYLIHGRGNDYTTWLGTPNSPTGFKNMIDNMIANGAIEPMIVVTPGLNFDYETDNKRMVGISHEVAYDLMPAVESKYSTYAKATDHKSLSAARDHRIIAGFSMGGSATWHILKNHVDLFSYFIPMSMAMYYDDNGYNEKKSIRSAQRISESLEKKGYGPDSFKVYAATGYEDYKAEAIYRQVKDLENSGDFIYEEEGLDSGNITFKIWPGRWHSHRQSYPYLYNALEEFHQWEMEKAGQ